MIIFFVTYSWGLHFLWIVKLAEMQLQNVGEIVYWGQFHQHFTRAFLLRMFCAKLFCACSEG